MTKIKFNQPKYVIPLIVLPFLFFGYYLYGNFKGKEDIRVQELTETKGINTAIPDPLLPKKTKNKLEAFKEALRTSRNNSAIGIIELEKVEKMKNEYQDSIKKAMYKDSIRNAYDGAMAKRNNATKLAEVSRQRLLDIASGKIQTKNKKSNSSINSIGNSRNSPNNSKSRVLNKQEKEMEAFKKQMLFIDSIANPQKYKRKKAIEDAKNGKTLTKENISISHELTKQKNVTTNYFNTIKANKEETFITALLDEGIKVWEGSRIRIRLLEDVFINGHLLKKGKYLYGIVNGFKQQRVEIGITSIVINDEILSVQISLYDNDGIQGIYVPDSSFRDFTKELGQQATSDAGSMSFEGDSKNSSELLYKSISSSFKTSTKAIQKALKNNKSKLKYNTQVYLVNSK